MHDTVMPNGELQSMVDSDGVPKGLKLVLQERGVYYKHGEGGHDQSLVRVSRF